MFGLRVSPSPCVCLSFLPIHLLRIHSKRMCWMIGRMRLEDEGGVVGIVWL